MGSGFHGWDWNSRDVESSSDSIVILGKSFNLYLPQFLFLEKKILQSLLQATDVTLNLCL